MEDGYTKYTQEQVLKAALLQLADLGKLQSIATEWDAQEDDTEAAEDKASAFHEQVVEIAFAAYKQLEGSEYEFSDYANEPIYMGIYDHIYDSVERAF